MRSYFFFLILLSAWGPRAFCQCLSCDDETIETKIRTIVGPAQAATSIELNLGRNGISLPSLLENYTKGEFYRKGFLARLDVDLDAEVYNYGAFDNDFFIQIAIPCGIERVVVDGREIEIDFKGESWASEDVLLGKIEEDENILFLKSFRIDRANSGFYFGSAQHTESMILTLYFFYDYHDELPILEGIFTFVPVPSFAVSLLKKGETPDFGNPNLGR